MNEHDVEPVVDDLPGTVERVFGLLFKESIEVASEVGRARMRTLHTAHAGHQRDTPSGEVSRVIKVVAGTEYSTVEDMEIIHTMLISRAGTTTHITNIRTQAGMSRYVTQSKHAVPTTRNPCRVGHVGALADAEVQVLRTVQLVERQRLRAAAARDIGGVTSGVQKDGRRYRETAPASASTNAAVLQTTAHVVKAFHADLALEFFPREARAARR
jgi:hypothetical protein